MEEVEEGRGSQGWMCLLILHVRGDVCVESSQLNRESVTVRPPQCVCVCVCWGYTVVYICSLL